MKPDLDNYGIPRHFVTGKGQWGRTWTLTFDDVFDFERLLEIANGATDKSITVSIARADNEKEVTLTLISGFLFEHQPITPQSRAEYITYWENNFRVILLLDEAQGRISRIAGQPRYFWRRFFAQADHERNLDQYKTGLILSAMDGDLQRMADELRVSNHIDGLSFSGKTALMYAAMYGHIKQVEFLLKNGASVTVSGAEFRPLQTATMSGTVQIVEMLLQAGAFIDDQDCYGMAALMHAANRGYLDIVRLLVREGATLGLRDKEGRTAIQWACELLKCDGDSDRYQQVLDVLKQGGGEDES